MDERLVIDDLSFGLSKDKPLFEHLNLTVKAGEVALLCGRSGEGKSVLRDVIDGYYPANGGVWTSGSIRVDGEDITDKDVPSRTRYVRTIFQNARLSFTMQNLSEEMIFCLENERIDQDKMDDIVAKEAERYHVTPLLNQQFDTLSGGELQRAAFVCSQLIDAPLYVFDEPFANLDDQAIEYFIQQIQRMKREGKAVLLIDHRVDLWDWADTWWLLNDKHLTDVTPNNENIQEKQRLLSEAGILTPGLSAKRSPENAAMAETEPVLKLEDVGVYREPSIKRKWFSRKKPSTEYLLNPFSLDIKPGEMAALVGESGGGKTSLLMTILKQRDYSGTITFSGKDIQDMKDDELFSQVGLIFQDPSLQFVSTEVAEEMRVSLQQQKAEDEEVSEDEILEHLSRYSLEEKIHTSPWVLSQGQQRRLAVLCMTLGKQKLLLVDEPTYGQDAAHAEEIMRHLRTLCEEGLACLFTSHDLRLVNAFADRIFVLKNHTIQEAM